MSTQDSTSSHGGGSALARLPRLDERGTNWILYKDQVWTYVVAAKLRRYIEGRAKAPTKPSPRLSDPADTASAVVMPTAAELETYEDEWDEWEYKNASVKSILNSTLPDTLKLKIRTLSAPDSWLFLCSEFDNLGDLHQVDLLTQMNEIATADGEDPRVALDRLDRLKAEYANAGGQLDDAHWQSIIIRSLPKQYKELVRVVLASQAAQAATLPAGTTKPKFTADQLLSIVRSTARDDRALEAKTERQAALFARTQSGSSSNQASRKKPGDKPKCGNCSKLGHKAGDCWAPGGGKEGQGPKSQGGGGGKKGGSGGHNGGGARANAAVTDGSAANYAFSVATDFAKVAQANLSHRARLLDTGATRHLDPTRANFATFREITPIPVTSADGKQFYATGEGDVPISVRWNDQDISIRLTDVLYAESMPLALVSVSRMTRGGFPVHFETDGSAHVLTPKRDILFKVPERNGLYPILAQDTPNNAPPVIAATAVTKMTLTELHERMGHAYAPALKKMVDDGVITGVKLSTGEAEFCTDCLVGKQKSESFPQKSSRPKAASYGDHVHSDVWGPARVQTPAKSRYFSTYLDDYSDEAIVSFMREKKQTFTDYKSWVAWAKAQRGMKVNKLLQSDRGGEYLSHAFDEFLKSEGTVRRLTVHDSPSQNGKGERLNDTLVSHGRTMLIKSGLPKTCWAEAIHHAAWLRNRTTTVNTPGSTPHERATGEKPDLSGLRLFGETAYVRIDADSKLDARSREGRWVGYDDESKGHRIYWAKGNKISVERNVRFHPNAAEELRSIPSEGGHVPDAPNTPSAPDAAAPPSTSAPSPPAPPKPPGSPPVAPKVEPKAERPPSTPSKATDKPDERAPSPASELAPEDEDVPPARETRARKPSAWLRDLQSGKGSTGGRGAQKLPNYGERAHLADALTEQGERAGHDHDPPVFALAAMAGDEPSYREATRDGPEKAKWREAMVEELDKIEARGTYELVPPPTDKNVVGNVWVLRRKRDEQNNVLKYKARLCAQGFSQIPGVDFHDTSAPTCRLSTLRYVVALAARHNLELHHVDFKNAYLYGELEETIYMRQPRGFEQPGKRDWVWRLIKALYGLKQAGRLWYEKVKALFASFGISPSSYDTCIFEYFDGDIVIIIAVHVDDCTIATNGLETMVELKNQLASSGFEIADLGEARFLLGIEIRRDRAAGTIALSQRAYIDTLIERFEMQEAKASAVPADPHVDLTTFKATDEDRAVMANQPYSALIGSLMYAAIGTRFDIQFVTSTLSRFMSDPSRAHHEAAKRVLRYLKGTRDLWLVLGSTRDGLKAYTDSDWASSAHRQSISGAIFTFDGAAFQWYSRKQALVALSSTEAEYIAQSEATKELEHFVYLQDDLPFPPLGGPPMLYSDNQSAITIARSGNFSHRTKHIHIKFRHVQSALERGILELEYLPTEEMLADLLTKALPRAKLEYFRELGGLRAA